MPFTGYKQFAPGTMQIMTDVYDAVRVQLELQPSDPRTSKLAVYIVDLVSNGVTDPAALTEKAVAELNK
jgi:hypothetical protein